MAWVYLMLAAVCEIVWSTGLKASNGLTRPGISVMTIVVMLLSFVLLSFAMKTLPLGTAYVIWTGIGTVGAAVVGLVWFGEPASALRLGCIGLIILGIVGLKWATPGQ
jgi:quaternary ammonium compound-resistance protein SugE